MAGMDHDPDGLRGAVYGVNNPAEARARLQNIDFAAHAANLALVPTPRDHGGGRTWPNRSCQPSRGEPVMPIPIDNPASWRAADLTPAHWLRHLTAAETDAVAAMLQSVRATGKPTLQLLPADVPLGAFAPVLQELTNALEHGIGFRTLRGLQPARFSPDDNRLLFWAIGTHLGVARPQSKASQLMSDVRADGGEYRGAGGRGYNTNAELDYHVDGTDVVGLYCLQTARSGGLSRVASSVAIHNEILRRDPGLVERLYQPFPHNRQNEEAPDETPFYMAPVFSNRDGHFAARYIRNHIRASQLRTDTPRLTERDHRALDIIQELAETDEFRFDMVLEQGDMQFLNNHVMLHSRTQFQDHEDPARKRHLLRLWLSVPNARPLCEGLRDAYKSIEPNHVRGGFKGRNITPELCAYQASTAAALGMQDTPY
jgi:hypothetical protein